MRQYIIPLMVAVSLVVLLAVYALSGRYSPTGSGEKKDGQLRSFKSYLLSDPHGKGFRDRGFTKSN